MPEQTTNQTVQPTVNSTLPPKTGMSTGAKIAIAAVVLLMLCGICIGSLFALGAIGAKKAENDLTNLGKEIEKSLDDYNKAEDDAKKFNEDNLKNPKSMSATADIDGVKWKVVEAKRIGATIKANAEYYKDCEASSGAEFIMVKMNVRNDASEKKSISTVKLIDGDDRTHEQYNDFYSCINTTKLGNAKIFSYETLNPGLQADYIAYFEIPKGQSDLKVEVSNLTYINEKLDYIKLDL